MASTERNPSGETKPEESSQQRAWRKRRALVFVGLSTVNLLRFEQSFHNIILKLILNLFIFPCGDSAACELCDFSFVWFDKFRLQPFVPFTRDLEAFLIFNNLLYMSGFIFPSYCGFYFSSLLEKIRINRIFVFDPQHSHRFNFSLDILRRLSLINREFWSRNSF